MSWSHRTALCSIGVIDLSRASLGVAWHSVDGVERVLAAFGLDALLGGTTLCSENVGSGHDFANLASRELREGA